MRGSRRRRASTSRKGIPSGDAETTSRTSRFRLQRSDLEMFTKVCLDTNFHNYVSRLGVPGYLSGITLGSYNCALDHKFDP